MTDVFQQGAQAFALQDGLTRAIVVFCAAYLVFVMAAVWVVIALTHSTTISLATIARFIALVIVAYVVAKIFNHIVVDTRPYLVEHTQPLASVARDNGFPSDHVLLATAFTAGLWWIDRRWIAAFAVATLLVMFGRLGIEAHHTLDVVGSVVIVVVSALVIGAIPLPAALERPALALLRPAAKTPPPPPQRYSQRGGSSRSGYR